MSSFQTRVLFAALALCANALVPLASGDAEPAPAVLAPCTDLDEAGTLCTTAQPYEGSAECRNRGESGSGDIGATYYGGPVTRFDAGWKSFCSNNGWYRSDVQAYRLFVWGPDGQSLVSFVWSDSDSQGGVCVILLFVGSEQVLSQPCPVEPRTP